MRRLLDYCSISKNVVSKFEGKKKYVATGDIIENEIKSFEKVTFDNRPSRAKQIGKNGDVIFAKMKDTVKVLKISDENEENIYSTGFFVLSPTEKINSNYLFWLLNSKKFNYEKDKRCHGATQKALNNEDLGKILIKDIPDIEQQINISDILEKTDNIIKDRKKQINELHELVKSQFVEMFGTPLKNEKQYLVCSAEEICLKITDGSHYSPRNQDKGYPMLSVKDMRNDGFHYENCKHISEEDFKRMQKLDCIPRIDDVLISKDGSYFYYGFVVEKEKEEAILSSIAMLRPNIKIINPYYLRYYMLSPEIIDLVSKNYVTGAALKRVILKGIKQIPVTIPNINDQNKFAKFVKQIDKQKFEIKKSLTEMENLYNSLMNEYFG